MYYEHQLIWLEYQAFVSAVAYCQGFKTKQKKSKTKTKNFEVTDATHNAFKTFKMYFHILQKSKSNKKWKETKN